MRYLLFVSTILLMISCKSKKDQIDINAIGLEEDNFKVILKKGACFGTCPVFTMTVHSDGMVNYEGKNFTERLGTYTKQLSTNEIVTLLQKIEDCDFYNLPDSYQSQIADLPSTKITVIDEDEESKSTSFKENKPESLEELHQYLFTIAKDESGWTLSKPAPLDEDISEDEKADPLVDQNELIIQPNEGVKIALWFKANKDKYGLFLKKKISPNENNWLFTYDTAKFSPEQIIAILKADADLKYVQFNVTVENRGN